MCQRSVPGVERVVQSCIVPVDYNCSLRQFVDNLGEPFIGFVQVIELDILDFGRGKPWRFYVAVQGVTDLDAIYINCVKRPLNEAGEFRLGSFYPDGLHFACQRDAL